MPGPQEIEFIIRPDGSVEEIVRGVDGASCEAVTKAIEDALGNVEERKHTSDFYNQSAHSGDQVTSSV